MSYSKLQVRGRKKISQIETNIKQRCPGSVELGNLNIDKVYIISLKKCTKKQQLCIEQLKYLNITNYKVIDAVNTITTYRYDNLYNLLSQNMDANFIKYNFQKGALGCLLSHLKAIEDAKENGYKNILVLEDDILINSVFWKKYKLIEQSISDYDFLYLGKKQLNMGNPNRPFYKPNIYTFASHAWLIKSNMYDILIDTYTTFKNPVDMAVFELFDNEKYKFGVVRDDLFITTEESDIREKSVSTSLFNWKPQDFFSGNIHLMKNIIIYGFKKSNHTHRYIHKQYYEFFKYYYPNLNIYWIDENDEVNIDFNNSIFFMSPCHHIYRTFLYKESCRYIFHLDNFDDNMGYKTIKKCLEVPFYRDLVYSDKAVILISREMPETNNLKYFEKDITKNIICSPWFGNTFYKEIKKSTKSYEIVSSKKYLCYLGSVWYLNASIIQKLIDLCIEKGIYLLIKGRIRVNLVTNYSEYVKIINYNYKNDDENSLEYIDSVYGVKGLLTIQGDEHNNTYMSNRIIECITSGYPAITNNLLASKYYKSVYYSPDIGELLDYYVKLVNNRDLWEKTLQKQTNEVFEKFYGYHNVTTLLDFVKDVNMKNNELISYYENTNRANQLYFVPNGYSNKFYIKCDNIRDLFFDKKCYTIDSSIVENGDIFLLEQVIKMYDYYVYIHDEYILKDQIIDICKKTGKEYKIRKNIEHICLLSSQRTGNTLFIDYIQKTSDKVLALSELFLIDDGIPIYKSEFDATKGILKNMDIEEYTISNTETYFQQFVDYAEFNDYEVLVYKITHDFFYDNMFRVLDFKNAMTFIQRSKIIYLDREPMDIFVSKKLAELNNSYSNVVYTQNIDSIYEEEYNFFIKTKSDFENEYVNNNSHIYKINYSFFIENDHNHNINFINQTLNNVLNPINNIKYLEHKAYFEEFNIFNNKQNKFYK